MREVLKVEVPAELAVDARQEVEVEPGGDARGIVVGALEDPPVLAEIDPDQEPVRSAQHLTHPAKKLRCLVAMEVADVRAQPQDHLGLLDLLAQTAESLLVFRSHRGDLQSRVAREQIPRGLLDHRGADVHRQVAEPAPAGEERVDQEPGLGRASAPQLHHRHRFGKQIRDLRCTSEEDGPLGAAEVVLGDPADLLEEERSLPIVEIAAGNLLGNGREPRPEVPGEGGPSCASVQRDQPQHARAL